MPSEQEKALEFRRKMQARQVNRLALERRMAGNAAARAELEAAWEPLRRWEGWSPTRLITERDERETDDDP